MCGIAGLFVSTKASMRAEAALDAVKSMTETFVHRGPDGHGAWADDKGRCFLGHRRLSIIDTTDAGLQPMSGAGDRWVITFNGEIYNYLELKRELQVAGVQFKGRTDTEVLIEALALWGEAALSKLDGMFAFAAFDRHTGRIFLARDAFGEKPLYYTTLANGAFAFASELQALEGLPAFDPTASFDAMAEVLSFQYIGAPRSIYASVHKLEPGSWMAIGADGARTSGRFFRFEPKGVPTTRSMSDLADELEDILVRSLERRLIADVPLGAFLSGGVDSSVVCALIRRRLNRPLKTFSSGFSNAPESEHLTARAFAEHLGTEHYENVVSPDVSAFLAQIGDVLDEPNGDSSCLPVYLLSQFVRQHVTVAVSGDGGDELFGGYGRYFATLEERDRHTGPTPFRPGQTYYGSRILVGQEPFIRDLFGFVPEGFAQHLQDLREDLNRSAAEGFLLEGMRRQDAENYMPGAVLPKVDRMSMRHSLEVRTPFLNMELARFAEHLPEEMLVQGGRGKLVLREVAYRYLPRDLIDLPKQGFGLPMSDWARESLLSVGGKVLLGDDARLAGAFGRENIESYLKQQGAPGNFSAYQLWGVVMLESWLQKHPAVLPEAPKLPKTQPRPNTVKPARKRLWREIDVLPLGHDIFMAAESEGASDEDPALNPAFLSIPDLLVGYVLDRIKQDPSGSFDGAGKAFRLRHWDEPSLEPPNALRGSTVLISGSLAREFGYPQHQRLLAMGVKRAVFSIPPRNDEIVELEFQKTNWLKLLRLFGQRADGAAASRKARRLFKLAALRRTDPGVLVFGPLEKMDIRQDQEQASSHAVFEGGRQLIPLNGGHGDLAHQAGRYSLWNGELMVAPTEASRGASRPFWLVPMSGPAASDVPIKSTTLQSSPATDSRRDINALLSKLTPLAAPNLQPGDRVVVCTHALPPGGAERQWIYLAQSLKALGFDVVFVTHSSLDGDNAHYLPALRRADIIHVDASHLSAADQILAMARYPVLCDMMEDVDHSKDLLKLAKAFDHLKPKAVFTQLDGSNLLAGMAGLAVGVPRIVLSFRNYNPTNFPYLYSEWQLPAYQLLSQSPNIVFSGNFHGANDDYAHWIGIDPARVHYIPNVIDGGLFPTPTEAQTAALRAELKLPNDAKIVLGVFRLSGEKDPLLFLDVCQRLCREDDKVQVLIAGIGPLAAKLTSRTREMGLEGRIRLLGRRDDVHVLVGLADLLLQTSRHEGMPNSIMEAQYLGAPVVATKAGGTADVVIDGTTGLLAAIGDIDGLTAHCRALLADPDRRRAMGEAARNNIQANFRLDQIGPRYLRAVDPKAEVGDTVVAAATV